MYTEDFIKKTNNIIKAYKGYNIMKNGHPTIARNKKIDMEYCKNEA